MPVRKINIDSSQRAMVLFGEEDMNLHTLENKYKVHVFVKRDQSKGRISLVIKGSKKRIDKALEYLNELEFRQAAMPMPSPQLPQDGAGSMAEPAENGAAYTTFNGRAILPKTENQRRYLEIMENSDMVFAIGPAGTGKTFLAVAHALRCLKAKKAAKIVLTRPVVEAGEKLGFLPGDLYEKVYPYLKPLYDALFVMLGPEKFKTLQVTETIEVVPLAYMRGRTLENAFIILDEAQNATIDQLKMFLTRMGMGSQVVVTGDVTQIDLEQKNLSGLSVAEKILGRVGRIVFVHFDEADVVRHPLVKAIIKAYEEWENSKPG